MGYLKGVLKEEQKRLEALCRKYSCEIALLPRGCVSIKKRREKNYLYLAYREGGKVNFKYIGPVSCKYAKAVLSKIELRKKYENKLMRVKKDLKEIGKTTGGRKL